jgi:hypothetical protein
MNFLRSLEMRGSFGRWWRYTKQVRALPDFIWFEIRAHSSWLFSYAVDDFRRNRRCVYPDREFEEVLSLHELVELAILEKDFHRDVPSRRVTESSKHASFFGWILMITMGSYK